MLSTIDEHPVSHSQLCQATFRESRLRQTSRFQAVRSQGRWWSHRLVALGVLANGLDVSRCGFSVTKRLGGAVVRNRLRRRMREVVRQHWQDVAPGWDIVLAAREPLRDAAYADIQAAVVSLMQRAHLMGQPKQ